jgi:hypothetical protein
MRAYGRPADPSLTRTESAGRLWITLPAFRPGFPDLD